MIVIKAMQGESLLLSLFCKKSNTDTVLIMDDIQDNTYFRNFVLKNKIENFFVFYFENKFVGLVTNCAFLGKIRTMCGITGFWYFGSSENENTLKSHATKMQISPVPSRARFWWNLA